MQEQVLFNTSPEMACQERVHVSTAPHPTPCPASAITNTIMPQLQISHVKSWVNWGHDSQEARETAQENWSQESSFQ